MAGSVRASGADVAIPSVHDAKAAFDEWLYSEPAEDSDDVILKRALGLQER